MRLYVNTNVYIMDIIDGLKQQRKFLKLSQEYVAGELGITAATLIRYEKGRRDMPLRIAERYAELLGFRLVLLFFEEKLLKVKDGV